MATPDVSIIIPAFNAQETVAGALRSALAQSHGGWEAIIVDDGSTDGTCQVVNAFESDRRVRLIRSRTNRGVSAARNLGMELARAPLLAFLDADDRWTSEKLRTQLAIHRQADRPDISYTDFSVARRGRVGGRRDWRAFVRGESRLTGTLLPSLLYENPLATSTVVMRRSLAQALGGFSPEHSPAEDYEFWIRAALSGAHFAYCPLRLTVYSDHAQGASKSLRRYQQGLRRVLRSHVWRGDWPKAIKARSKALFALDIGRRWQKAGAHRRATRYYRLALGYGHLEPVAWIVLLFHGAASLVQLRRETRRSRSLAGG